MRTLPIELSQALSAESCSIGHLIKIVLYNTVTQLDVPIYFTDKDMNVVCDIGDGSGEKTWLSRGIEFTDGQQSLSPKVDSVTFEIDNVALEFSSYVMNYETRGKECTIYRAAFDENLRVLGATVLFPGMLDRIEVDHQRARFEVANSFIRWGVLTPRRKHASTCFWSFKSTECGYSGGLASCDKSWDACVTRARTASFGGFRFSTALESGKKVVWGRDPAD